MSPLARVYAILIQLAEEKEATGTDNFDEETEPVAEKPKTIKVSAKVESITKS